MALLEAEGLAKSYGETRVFADISLTLQAGELVALLGESAWTSPMPAGCCCKGKT